MSSSIPKCKSQSFPCPAGDRCPEHKDLMLLLKNGNYSKVLEYLEGKKLLSLAESKISPSTQTETGVKKPKTPEGLSLRNGIFIAASRTYGESYIEPVVRKIFNLEKALNGDHDGYDALNKHKYEIKTSKVLVTKPKTQTPLALLDTIINQAQADPLSRIVSFNDRKTARFDANIQNIKRDHFDYMIYSLLYEEGMQIFKIHTTKVSSVPNWSGKHGRYDQEGKSGQFSIKCGNIEKHEKNSFNSFYTWDDLVPIFKEINA